MAISKRIKDFFEEPIIKQCNICGKNYVLGEKYKGLQLFLCHVCFHDKCYKAISPHEYLEVELVKMEKRVRKLEEVLVDLVANKKVTDPETVRYIEYMYDRAGDI